MAEEARTHCKGCGIELVADDEERLVELVQSHIAEAHPGGHSPTREQVLAVIRSRTAGESSASPSATAVGRVTPTSPPAAAGRSDTKRAEGRRLPSLGSLIQRPPLAGFASGMRDDV